MDWLARLFITVTILVCLFLAGAHQPVSSGAFPVPIRQPAPAHVTTPSPG